VLLDQVTKWWIVKVLRLPDKFGGKIELSPIFDLTYVENKGASFGMLAGGLPSRLVLSAISLGVSVALLIWLARVVRPLVAAGVAFIIGGALGNFIDRATLGYVVDFLDFSGLHFPWVFNVADAAINVGIGLFLLDALLESRTRKAGAP
jgi:signal peptidase II